MKKKNKAQGINLSGSLRQAGITIYQKQGQTIIRSAHSRQKKTCTRKQFVQRQRMRHTIALWQKFDFCDKLFTEHKTAYLGFASMANRLPAVYATKDEARNNLSLLMPDIPVSEGTLTPIKQHLGEVNGVAALLTDLKLKDIKPSDEFWLYIAEQCIGHTLITVDFKMRKVKVNEMTQTEEGLALIGEEYADENKGWALVRVRVDRYTPKSVVARCSSQGIVTLCTLYQKYTTDEALEEAIKSYGKLVRDEAYLSPRR